MCGIAGFVGLGNRSDLERMTVSLTHRGPDDQGLYVDSTRGVFLGHRRLAILDLAGGAQPMWDPTGEIGITFNGEIYNHMALRAEPQRLGHRFVTSHSDTETLIHAYREWGETFPMHDILTKSGSSLHDGLP